MSEPLYAPASLRPWLRAGLAHLLLDSPERRSELKADPSATPSDALRSVQTAMPVHAGGTGADRKKAPPQDASPAGNRRTAGSGRPPDQRGQVAANPSGGKESTPHARERAAASRVPGAALARGRILPPEAWPPAWVALRNRRPLPPRPLVFWTYAGLGEDLMGTADPARQQVIVRMLTALRHPGGTHVFWPYELPASSPSESTPDAPETKDAPSLFWSGVAMLRPRALLLFGSDARDALGLPKSLTPFVQTRLDGLLIIQLPQPSALAGASSDQAQQPRGDDAFRRAQAFLARLLQFCAPQG